MTRYKVIKVRDLLRLIDVKEDAFLRVWEGDAEWPKEFCCDAVPEEVRAKTVRGMQPGYDSGYIVLYL